MKYFYHLITIVFFLISINLKAETDSCHSLFNADVSNIQFQPVVQKESWFTRLKKTLFGTNNNNVSHLNSELPELPETTEVRRAQGIQNIYLNNNTHATKTDPLESAQRIKNFFDAVNLRLQERSELLDTLIVALISQQNIMILGPPGTAKSMIANLVGKNILEVFPDNSKSPSFWSHQMTPESTMSDTHGPMDFRKLEQNNEYRRLLNEGLLNAQFVFVDEFFDGNPKTIRNLLQAFNERTHTEGQNVTHGKIRTAVVTSNKSVEDAYHRAERVGDPKGPAAIFDRFAFVFYIPGDFASLESEIKMLSQINSQGSLPEVFYQDIDNLANLEVNVPVYIDVYLSILNDRMKTQLGTHEQSAIEKYKNEIKMGGSHVAPPYRKKKEYSKRTLYNSKKVLRAMIIKDWILKGGQRELVASMEDIKMLEKMLVMNGAADDVIEEMIGRSVDPDERTQQESVLLERKIFRETFEEVLTQANEEIYKFALSDVTTNLEQAKSQGKLEEYVKELFKTMGTLMESSSLDIRPWEADGSLVGRLFVINYLEEQLTKHLGAETVQKLKQEISEELLKKQLEKTANEDVNPENSNEAPKE